MITYNHEKYIREAIEGVLMQECNFEVELIISDDKSPDNTESIVLNIIENHKNGNWITYNKNNENLGVMPNFISALEKCKGQYIALCEGDDYWTDPLKLQKQVDFLKENESYSGVASKSEVYYMESGERRVKESHNKKTITNKDLQKNLYFQTATFMFRREIIKHFEYLPILSGDKYLFLLIASYGDIHMLQEVTSVYRKHPGGVSHFVTSSQILTDILIADKIKKHSKEFLPNEYKIHILEKVFLASSVIYFSDLINTTKIYFRITLFNKMEHSRFWYFKHFYRLLQKGIKKIKFKRIAG